MAESKTTARKAPAKRPAATRKAVTAARSATVKASKAKPEPEPEPAELVDEVDDEAPLVGSVVGADEVDDGASYVDAADPHGSYYRPDRGEVKVPAGLSFTSKPKDRVAEGVGEERPFEIDGEVYVAHRPPDDTFILLSTASATTTPQADRLASIVQFVAAVVDEQDFLRLYARMQDKKDDFGFLDLVDVMETVVGTFAKDKGPRQARAMARPPRR